MMRALRGANELGNISNDSRNSDDGDVFLLLPRKDSLRRTHIQKCDRRVACRDLPTFNRSRPNSMTTQQAIPIALGTLGIAVLLTILIPVFLWVIWRKR